MLINDDQILLGDPILNMVAKMNGNTEPPKLLQQGVYQVGHFGSSDFPRGFNHYPTLSDYFGPYGVCDNVQQILDQCPELEASTDRQFLITVTPIVRANQEPQGGWRWHKWGEYIGEHNPQHEYLYDEKDIDQVLVFHIYERG